MGHWAQHTRITAALGRRDELVAKFAEVPVLQRDDPDHLLTLVGVDGDHAVTVTEVWTSEQSHERATRSPAVVAWAEGMADLVAGPPVSERFTVVVGLDVPAR
jgi:quinol monooxygenase YgiN